MLLLVNGVYQSLCIIFCLRDFKARRVVLSMGPGRRGTGDAFAQFDSVEAAMDALSFNHESMIDRVVELFPCNEDEMLKHTNPRAVVSGELGPPPGGFLPGGGPSTEDARKRAGPPQDPAERRPFEERGRGRGRGGS